MASKNAFLILSLLAIIVLISSEVSARGLPDTFYNSKTVEDVKKTIDHSEIGRGMSGAGNNVDMRGEANKADESKGNPRLDGMGGVGHRNRCNHVCCTLPNRACVCC